MADAGRGSDPLGQLQQLRKGRSNSLFLLPMAGMGRHHIVKWFRNVLAVSVAPDATSTCVASGTLMVDNDEADNIANCRGTWPLSCEATDSREQLQRVRVSGVGPIEYLGTWGRDPVFARGEAATEAELTGAASQPVGDPASRLPRALFWEECVPRIPFLKSPGCPRLVI